MQFHSWTPSRAWSAPMTSGVERQPRDLAFRARQSLSRGPQTAVRPASQWRRETFTLPREAAREKAREVFSRFPKAAYMTEVESWRVVDDDIIEFTMRRLPTAD
jgi:hypothetical protein